MIGFNGDGVYAVGTPTDALPVTLVTSNIPTAARTSAAQKDKTKICATSLILKIACRDKKLWLVLIEAISAPAMVLEHPGTHSSNRRSLIVVSPTCRDKKLWLVLIEAISAPAMVLEHPGTHSSNRRSLIVVSPCMEWHYKFLSLKLS
jgi:hypothetical protein